MTDRLSIRWQVLAPAVVAVVVLGTVAALLAMLSDRGLRAVHSLELTRIQQSRLLQGVSTGAAHAQLALYNQVLMASVGVDSERIVALGARVGVAMGQAREQLARLRAEAGTAVAQDGLADIEDMLGKFAEEAAFTQSILEADPVMASVMMSQADGRFDELERLIARQQALVRTQSHETLEQARSHSQHASAGLLAALLLGCLAACAMAWIVARAIVHPLVALAGAAERSGLRETKAWPGGERRDEIGSLSRALAEAQAMRDAAEQALSRHASELEAMVSKRTGELEARRCELERSNEELRRFAYVASHDLQEPLRTVASYVQLLSRRYHDQLDGRANRYIGFAVDGVSRMQALIQGLLDYSRIGTEELVVKPVDFGRCLDDALDNLRLAIEREGASIVRGRLPAIVDADPIMLVQLLQNLLANALKFRGELPPRVEIGAVEIGAVWRIHVADNGIGISPEFRECVFEVFQRLHSREEFEGTGIGLAVCQRIVERHGGEIGVDSNAAGGATFTFTLPVRRAERALPSPISSAVVVSGACYEVAQSA